MQSWRSNGPLNVGNEESGNGPRRFPMRDILWIAVTLVFFTVAIAYVRFCDRMK